MCPSLAVIRYLKADDRWEKQRESCARSDTARLFRFAALLYSQHTVQSASTGSLVHHLPQPNFRPEQLDPSAEQRSSLAYNESFLFSYHERLALRHIYKSEECREGVFFAYISLLLLLLRDEYIFTW